MTSMFAGKVPGYPAKEINDVTQQSVQETKNDYSHIFPKTEKKGLDHMFKSSDNSNDYYDVFNKNNSRDKVKNMLGQNNKTKKSFDINNMLGGKNKNNFGNMININKSKKSVGISNMLGINKSKTKFGNIFKFSSVNNVLGINKNKKFNINNMFKIEKNARNNINYKTDMIGLNRLKEQNNFNLFGDKDKDGVQNIFDCSPGNPKKQAFVHSLIKSLKGEEYSEDEKNIPLIGKSNIQTPEEVIGIENIEVTRDNNENKVGEERVVDLSKTGDSIISGTKKIGDLIITGGSTIASGVKKTGDWINNKYAKTPEEIEFEKELKRRKLLAQIEVEKLKAIQQNRVPQRSQARQLIGMVSDGSKAFAGVGNSGIYQQQKTRDLIGLKSSGRGVYEVLGIQPAIPIQPQYQQTPQQAPQQAPQQEPQPNLVYSPKSKRLVRYTRKPYTKHTQQY